MKRLFTFLGWPILALPIFLMIFGAFCNELVVNVNGMQMPVATPGVCHIGPPDVLHKCEDKDTKLKLLDDRLPSDGPFGGVVISSIGDFLQDLSGEIDTECKLVWLAGAVYFFVLRREHSL